MIFYILTAVIPLGIIAIYLWRFRPNIIRGLWETIPPLLGYFLLVYVIEREEIINIGWVLYTLVFFGFPYLVIVSTIRVIQWIRNEEKNKRPIVSRTFKFGLIIISSLTLLVMVFYLNLVVWFGQSIGDSTKNYAEIRKRWKENDLKNKRSKNRLELVANLPFRTMSISDSLKALIDSIIQRSIASENLENEVELITFDPYLKQTLAISQDLDSLRRYSYNLWNNNTQFTVLRYQSTIRDSQGKNIQFEVEVCEVEHRDLTGTYYLFLDPSNAEILDSNYVDRN